MGSTTTLAVGDRVLRRNVLGELRSILLAAASVQKFSAIDPTGIDNPTRLGERLSTECYGFLDELEWFWNHVGDLIYEAAGFTPTERFSRLKRIDDGGFYSTHIDGAYPGAAIPQCSFLYYVGDRSSYEGGQLVFDDASIDPEDDLLVVFRCADPHGVSRVTSAPGREALRLTIAGHIL